MSRKPPALPRPLYFCVKGEPEPDIRGGVDVGSQPLSSFLPAPGIYSGVRSKQARNTILTMAPGSLVLYYHAGCKKAANLGLAGIVRVRAVRPDPTASDPAGPFFYPAHSLASPVWHAVVLEHVETFPRLFSLAELKAAAAINPTVGGMSLLKQPRLSVSAVTPAQWDEVVELARNARV